MTELYPQPEVSGRSDIDTSSVGLLTIDTGSQAIISCNDAFAGVLERPAGDVPGRPITDFVDDEVRSVATAVIAGIRAGYISSVDGNVDLLRPSGSVGVDCWILALGTGRPRTMAIAGVIAGDGSEAPDEDAPRGTGFRPTHVDPGRIALATMDDEWRIRQLAPGSAEQLGLPAPDATAVMPRLSELAHPDDALTLLGSYERRAATGAPETFALRLHGADGQFLAARATVSPLCGSVGPRFGLVVRVLHPEGQGGAESDRVARLEQQLARIRQVVQGTDHDAATVVADLSDLTTRQREIVARLLDGHRVDAIARDLYVSPSTVRNHLSAIFEKLGVASQSELIELLRDRSMGARPDADPDAL